MFTTIIKINAIGTYVNGVAVSVHQEQVAKFIKQQLGMVK